MVREFVMSVVEFCLPLARAMLWAGVIVLVAFLGLFVVKPMVRDQIDEYQAGERQKARREYHAEHRDEDVGVRNEKLSREMLAGSRK